jgi:hypothetical protein
MTLVISLHFHNLSFELTNYSCLTPQINYFIFQTEWLIKLQLFPPDVRIFYVLACIFNLKIYWTNCREIHILCQLVVVLLVADQIQTSLFDALTHMPNPVLVPSNTILVYIIQSLLKWKGSTCHCPKKHTHTILALQIEEYHYFRFEPHASACYKTACAADHIDVVTFSMPARGWKITKGILKMTNQRVIHV